jgi:hypothetical protein
MKSATKITCAALFALLPLWGVNPQQLKSAEARKLAVAARPAEVKSSDVTIELDREQSHCAIYHAYRLSKGEPPFQTFTIGWWSVDLRTGELWDELNSQRVTNRQIDAIQRTIRKRFGVSPEEIAGSRSKPCYERYVK